MVCLIGSQNGLLNITSNQTFRGFVSRNNHNFYLLTFCVTKCICSFDPILISSSVQNCFIIPFLLQKLLTIFPKAETVKKILTEQFRIEEEKRTEREVNGKLHYIIQLACNRQFNWLKWIKNFLIHHAEFTMSLSIGSLVRVNKSLRGIVNFYSLFIVIIRYHVLGIRRTVIYINMPLHYQVQYLGLKNIFDYKGEILVNKVS